MYSLAVTFTARASNDECDSATPPPLVQPDTPVNGDNMGASTSVTIDPASLCGQWPGSGGGADVFYRFVPQVSGEYYVGTCGSQMDTVLSVHGGCPATSTNVIACNDDAPHAVCASTPHASRVSVDLDAGEMYFIRVAGFRAGADTGGNPAVGSFTLTVHLDDPSGACCQPNTLCMVMPSGRCGGFGSFRGSGSVCSPDPCQPPGACCIGATCAMRTQSDCVSPAPGTGAVFMGGQDCGNPTSPCCRADFNKMDSVSVQDIFDYLEAWFAGSPFTHLAGANTGPPTVQDIFDFLSVWFAGC